MDQEILKVFFYDVRCALGAQFTMMTAESEPPLKPSPLKCYKQSGTNTIIVLIFVEPQRVHI